MNLIWPYPQKSSRTSQHNLRIKFGISEGRLQKFLEVGWPYPQRSSRPLQYDLRIELSMSDWQRQKSFAVDWHPKSSSNCGDEAGRCYLYPQRPSRPWQNDKSFEVAWQYPQTSSRLLRHDSRILMSMSDCCKPLEVIGLIIRGHRGHGRTTRRTRMGISDGLWCKPLKVGRPYLKRFSMEI